MDYPRFALWIQTDNLVVITTANNRAKTASSFSTADPRRIPQQWGSIQWLQHADENDEMKIGNDEILIHAKACLLLRLSRTYSYIRTETNEERSIDNEAFVYTKGLRMDRLLSSLDPMKSNSPTRRGIKRRRRPTKNRKRTRPKKKNPWQSIEDRTKPYKKKDDNEDRVKKKKNPMQDDDCQFTHKLIYSTRRRTVSILLPSTSKNEALAAR